MRVDFQIIHTISSNIKEYLLDLLKETFDESTTIYEEIEEKPDNLENWSIFNWIEIKYNCNISEDKFIAGFTLEIDENLRGIIQAFGDNLNDDDNIEVLFKYFDEGMLKDHKDYVEEIFELEMKLREIFSFVFIDTYKEDYYSLLKEVDVNVQPLNGKHKPNEEYLRKHFENEFFFLLFSDYIRLDNLRKINHNDLMEMIKSSNSYDELRQNIQNRGITKERYKELIASIRQNLEPVENMRNCIAHNRSFTDTILENYQQAKEKLDTIISEFWEDLRNES
jgi:hypothetical protein